MSFKDVLCMMSLYSHNMKVIHWNSTGDKFDRIHEIADKYYDMFQSSIDSMAEMMGMMDEQPPSFVEMFNILSEANEDLIEVKGDTLYEYEPGVGLIATMLDSTVKALEELHDDIDGDSKIGIKSNIENMHYEFSKERDYFNKRRSS